MKKIKKIDFLKYYVKPHNRKSRDVKASDILRVMADAHIMYNLCYTKRGFFNGAFAIAHQQIDNEDPLRFYVTVKKDIIINPVIKLHTRHTVNSNEGCLSFPDNKMKIVQRWNKCEVEAITIDSNKKLTKPKLIKLNGRDSFIAQHEIDHFDCKYIFDY